MLLDWLNAYYFCLIVCAVCQLILQLDGMRAYCCCVHPSVCMSHLVLHKIHCTFGIIMPKDMYPIRQAFSNVMKGNDLMTLTLTWRQKVAAVVQCYVHFLKIAEMRVTDELVILCNLPGSKICVRLLDSF